MTVPQDVPVHQPRHEIDDDALLDIAGSIEEGFEKLDLPQSMIGRHPVTVMQVEHMGVVKGHCLHEFGAISFQSRTGFVFVKGCEMMEEVRRPRLPQEDLHGTSGGLQVEQRTSQA